MQDTELFFQNADHRHLFLYLDGLAANEARGHVNVSECEQRNRDENQDLYKKIEMLESKLQCALDEKALLLQQISQENHKAYLHSFFSDLQNNFTTVIAGTPVHENNVSEFASLYADMIFLCDKFEKSKTFYLFRENGRVPEYIDPIKAKNELWESYLQHIGIKDMGEILICCQKSFDPVNSMSEFIQSLFLPLQELKQFFSIVITCLDSVCNITSVEGKNNFILDLNIIRDRIKNISYTLNAQKKNLADLYTTSCIFKNWNDNKSHNFQKNM